MKREDLPAGALDAKPASAATQALQAQVRAALPFEDRRSFEDSERGFIATRDPMTITRDNGRVVFDLSRLGFLAEDAPDTVNPSLWRQAQLTALHHGLYEVVPGIWQVRSFDIANMTLIKGDTGWVVIDPLTSSEASAAALQLANEQLGKRPVSAVIITHSHADHFAGTLGVVDPADVASGKVPLVAPKDFVNEALSENVLAGNVMNRRATYMYGNLLESSPQQFVTTGLGAALSMGTTGFVVPNDTINETGERRTLDGVEVVFQMTMGTEAPAEMVFYFPAFKALCMSEITSHHLHNVYTPRGAQVRDALAWSAQIQESIDLFGDDLEVEFASHHWPIHGREAAVEYLEKQRDLYKFIHDQALRLANHGLTKEEIAEQVRLPDALGQEFYNRDYYGHLKANVKAVYVKYLGHFSGNPAELDPLPPVPVAERYVEFMGGADAVVEKARSSFDAGDYRWVVEVLNHVVMAQPDHWGARALAADAMEQLGYQTESAPWRNFYLCGALELRQGTPKGSNVAVQEGIAVRMPLGNLFQAMAVRLNADKADGVVLHLNLELTDLPSPWLLSVERSVLHAFEGRRSATPTATLKLDSGDFKRMMLGVSNAADLLADGKLQVDGDLEALVRFAGLFDQFVRRFPIIEPRPAAAAD